jgi:hypothetical protein
MNKLIVSIFALFLWVTISAAQVPLNPAHYNVADLPAANLNLNKVVTVDDGVDQTDCTVGGGSAPKHPCVSNGTTWIPYGDGTGAGGAVTGVSGTTPIHSSGGTTPNISIDDAVADGATKGAPAFNASDFDAVAGVISLDITNAQAADTSHKGFLTATDWNTFNSKISACGNPTALVGLTAINGSASTCMRSDGAPALDQNIAPTWTNTHIFGTTVRLTSTGADYLEVKPRAFFGNTAVPFSYDASDVAPIHVYHTVTNPNLSSHQDGIVIWNYVNTATNVLTTQDVYGMRVEVADVSASTGNLFGIQGIRPYVLHQSSTATLQQLLNYNGRTRNQGTLTTMWGVNMAMENTGTITGDAMSYRAVGINNSGTISGNFYHYLVDTPLAFGTVTGNVYGFYSADLSGHARGWNLYSVGASSRHYIAGKLGIGTTTLSEALNVTGNISLSGTITGTWNGNIIGLAYGGSGSNLSATGGTGQVLKQTTAGGVVTVGTVGASELSGLGSGVAAWLASATSANLRAAMTDETGTGQLVFATSPSLVTPSLGVATATSINKITLTAPATGATLTLSDGTTTVVTGGGTLALGGFTFTVPGNRNRVLTTRTITEGAGLAGNTYDLSANRTLAMGTPSTLTVATTNSASGTTHSHAITTSSNPGAAASILASTSGGALTLVRLNTDTLADKSGGNLTIAPAGDLIFDPTGNDLLPTTNYDLNIGALDKKYLTLHAAELWVETLVAQNTLATIGGRVVVAPTTPLSADLAPAGTTITTKYNNLNNGDRVYLEANGKVEFMAVASSAGGAPGRTPTL